jgi:3-deoxy-7-phosphoheptulonate synthase / chorismate mutase
MRIADWRRKIDGIDAALLHLLNLRAELAVEVGRLKRRKGISLRVPEREKQILNRMNGLNLGPFSRRSIERIYQTILEESLRTQESYVCEENPALDPVTERMPSGRRKVIAA